MFSIFIITQKKEPRKGRESPSAAFCDFFIVGRSPTLGERSGFEVGGCDLAIVAKATDVLVQTDLLQAVDAMDLS